MSADRPRIVYLLNAYDRGGAELGLIKLVEGGLFEGTDLKIVALVRGEGSVLARLKDLGCDATFLVDRARMRPRDLVPAFRAVRRLLCEVRPMAVIASLPQANIIARVAAWRHRDITLVSFEHNTHLAKRVYEILYWLTSPRVDWVFADAKVTMATALDRLYRRRPAPEHCNVVPLVEFADPARRSPPEPGTPFHVINVARLTDVKNQAALIRASALLRGKGHAVRLTLYGEGPNRDAYAALARDLGIAEHVAMPGFVADWPARPADAFVLSSHHEGLCIVLLEAMQTGLPIAAPLVGGIRDYGGPEVMEVVPDPTPDCLAAAILALMHAPAETRAGRTTAAADLIDTRYGRAAVRTTLRTLSARLRALR